jgi:aspartyl-tRNA(Asn)/glutamyl-tRNA(Gln) amidotransferase subunit A
MDAAGLCFTPAVELAELIRRRALSPVEVTRAVLERIERLNPSLGAYVLVHAERALGEARAAEQAVMAGRALGLLHGVPVSIKDNLWTAGERATYGSRLMADFVAPEDAPSVAGLRAAGAILIGWTNLPEFAWRGSTDNPLFGETRNPWDLTRTPGGSTGGGAAAVAAGLAPLALGSDGAGSRSASPPASAGSSATSRRSGACPCTRPPGATSWSPTSARWRARCATWRS